MGLIMAATLAQQEIDSILKILNEAKQYSGLGPNDPAVVALEQIMLAKVAVLEAANVAANTAASPAALETASEQSAPPEVPPLLLAVEDEASAAPPHPGQAPETKKPSA